MRQLLPAPVRIFTLVTAVVAAGVAATQVKAADVTIAVSNIEAPAGMLYWSVFDSAESYDSDGTPVLAARARVDGDALSFTVHDLSTGRYAVKLFHDANGNGELDANMIGIPTEGYGFSNNAGRFGPAGFEEAAVEVDGDIQIDIRVR